MSIYSYLFSVFSLFFHPLLGGSDCLFTRFCVGFAPLHYLRAAWGVDGEASDPQLMLSSLDAERVEDRVHPVKVDPLLATVLIHDLDLVIFESRISYQSPSVTVEHYFTTVTDAFLNCHASSIPQPEQTAR